MGGSGDWLGAGVGEVAGLPSCTGRSVREGVLTQVRDSTQTAQCSGWCLVAKVTDTTLMCVPNPHDLSFRATPWIGSIKKAGVIQDKGRAPSIAQQDFRPPMDALEFTGCTLKLEPENIAPET